MKKQGKVDGSGTSRLEVFVLPALCIVGNVVYSFRITIICKYSDVSSVPRSLA